MKLSNQSNGSFDHFPSKQFTVCLGKFCTALLVLFCLFSSEKTEAGFCWDMSNSPEGCEVKDFNNFNVIHNKAFYLTNINSDKRFKSPAFRFRSDCHNPSGGCHGQDWEISFIEYYYIYGGFDLDKTTPYQLNAKFNLKSGNEVIDNWTLGGTKISGNKKNHGDDRRLFGNRAVSGEVFLELALTKDQLGALRPGRNRFMFVLKGEDVESNVISRLYYSFYIYIPDSKQVKISGLSPVELGIFPRHIEHHDQDFCIHSSGDGKFGLTASGNFSLQSKDSSISYKASVAMKSNRSGIFELVNGQKFTKDANGIELSGSSSEGCTAKGKNMKLVIELTEPFESLSTKPAGNYVDTLTLTVSAE